MPSLAKQPQQLAAVDATQGSEIIFALLGGMLLLHTPMPSGLSFVGLLVIIGLVLLPTLAVVHVVIVCYNAGTFTLTFI